MDAATILGMLLTADESAGRQPVDPVGHGAARDHGLAHERAGGELVGTACPPQRGQECINGFEVGQEPRPAGHREHYSVVQRLISIHSARSAHQSVSDGPVAGAAVDASVPPAIAGGNGRLALPPLVQ